MRAMSEADLRAMTRMIEGDAAVAVNQLQAARDRQAALTSDVLPRARMAIEPAVAGYASGQLPLVSVIEAVQALWLVQSDLIAADTRTRSCVGAAGPRHWIVRGDRPMTSSSKRPANRRPSLPPLATAAAVHGGLVGAARRGPAGRSRPRRLRHRIERMVGMEPSAERRRTTAYRWTSAATQSLDIRLESVGRESLTQTVRAVATVVPDESRISHVHTRVAGWVEQLDVNTTGEVVRAGQPLARIFSQELLSSQTEYLSARKNTAASGITSVVVASGRTRLGGSRDDPRGDRRDRAER